MVPQLWIVAGPNGAGKSTLVSSRLAERITVVNPDVIAQELPRRDDRLDERRAGEIAIEQRNQLLSQRANFAIETTLTGNSALRLMRAAKTADYKVTLVYVGLTSASLSLTRVLDRVSLGGHPVPVPDLQRRFPASMNALATALGVADRSYVFDNSARRRRLLLTREGGRNKFLAADLPAWATRALGVAGVISPHAICRRGGVSRRTVHPFLTPAA